MCGGGGGGGGTRYLIELACISGYLNERVLCQRGSRVSVHSIRYLNRQKIEKGFVFHKNLK